MPFPPESVSLGGAWANKSVFATYKLPGAPMLAWNGSAGATNTPANLILGAVVGTCDAEGTVSFQPVSALAVQYVSEVWPQAASNPVASDITTPPAGVNIPLAQGGGGQVTLAASQPVWSGGSSGYSGTAQGNGGGANTIQLAAGASSEQNYVNQQIVIYGTTAGIEVNTVISYNPTTKVATCSSNWVNTVGNTTPYAFPGLLGSVTIGANGIASPQSFNNTGQVNPLPIIPPYGLSVISATGAQSSTYTGETLNAVINYPFTFTWQYIGANSTGWTQFVWTVKALETDPDANAILTIKVTNPSSGSDGLILQNGTSPVSATEGSLVVSLAPVAGQTATTITVSLNATGMGLAAVLSGFWETTAYLSGVKQPPFDGGPFIVNASVRAAAGQA